MKYLIPVILFLHGAIHLMGFVKGFQLAEIQNLQSNISKTSAIVWLMVFLLFTLSSVLFLFNNNVWLILAGAGLLISTLLIIGNWGDAKYGMIPNLIIALILVISFSGFAFSRKIARETQLIVNEAGKPTEEIVSEEDIADLPFPVKNWLLLSGIVGKQIPVTVWLQQKFDIKLKPGQEKWYKADAEQYFTTNNPAFIWTVKLNMSALMKITGRDKFMDGKGEMQMKMNSIISLGKETGEKMNEGTLQRYLGEMVWFPAAMLNPYVTWEEIDPFRAKATMNYRGTTGSGIFHFDEKGDFVKFSAMRYMGNDPDAKRYEWVITVDDYSIYEGIKIPSKMRATWMMDEGEWTWCVIEIKELIYNKKL